MTSETEKTVQNRTGYRACRVAAEVAQRDLKTLREVATMKAQQETTAIPSLRDPDARSLNGKHSAYCSVCWNAVYALWIDDMDHGGRCPEGATEAHKCQDAMGRAKLSAQLAKLRKEGVIYG